MLTVAQARALITTSLSDAALEEVIEREEAWLARRIGPLDGERAETFIPDSGEEALLLQRPASVIAVDDEGGSRDDDVDLRAWSDVVLTTGVWSGTVTVTYTPDDEPEVARALISLVRLAVSESAFASESAQGYSSATDVQAQRTTRWAAWHGLLRPRRPGTTRISGSLAAADHVSAVSVVALGS